MKSLFFALIAGVIVLTSAPLHAADAFEGSAPTDVTVTGHVVDENGAPARGLKIEALSSKQTWEAISSAEGQFEFSVPAKDAAGLTLLARQKGGTSQGFYQFPFRENEPAQKPVTLVLRPARKISVHVANAEGKPVADSWTAVASARKLAEATTDAAGNALLLVPADAPLVHVVASKSGVGLDYFAFRRKDEPASDPYKLPPDHQALLKLVLNGTRTVTVRVLDPHQQPMVGVTVAPWYFNKPKKGGYLDSDLQELNTVTDADGIATIHIPADNVGNVTIWARTEGYWAPERCTWNPQSREESVTINVVALVKVQGSASFPDGRRARGIEIVGVGAGYQVDGFHGSTRTNDDGKFEISVYPDQYYIFAPRDERWSAPAQTFVLQQSGRDDVDFVLQPTVHIYGQLTVGPDQAAWEGQYVVLIQKSENYYDLPEAQRLPNPTKSRQAIQSQLGRFAVTDAEGGYEFFAGPGRYYLRGPGTTVPQEFEINDQSSLELNLHEMRKDRNEFSGRVVLKAEPTRGVVEAKVNGYATEMLAGSLAAITDKDGRFQSVRSSSNMLVHASSNDGKLAGVVEISAEDKECVIPVEPTGSAHGRLLDASSDLPMPNKTVEYGIRITHSNKTMSTHFGGTATTDDQGRFQFSGLAIGREYTINAVIEIDNHNRPCSWRTVGKVTVKDVSPLELGDLKLAPPDPPYRPPTPKERIAKDFAKPQPLEEQLRVRTRDVRLAHQRVLLVAAPLDSELGEQLYTAFYDTDDREVWDRFVNYLLLTANTAPGDREAESRDVLQRIGAAWPAADDVTLCVVGTDGKLVGQLTCKTIVVDGKLDRKRLAEFLGKHVPEMPDAEKVFAGALTQAKQEQKRVLVQETGALCGPCLMLSRFLDEHRDLIAKDYVYIHLDRRFANGEAVINRLRSESRGVPWTVILDSEGNAIINSDAPDGNIGFPSTTEGRAHFEKMLRTTARRLNDQDIQALLGALAKTKP